jgi:hypothetical protein
MRVDDGISTSDCAVGISGNGSMTINNATIADVTFSPPYDRPERIGTPALDRAMSAQFRLGIQLE